MDVDSPAWSSVVEYYCLLAKFRAQILSVSSSPTPRLLKTFPFPMAYRLGAPDYNRIRVE